ncbi:MAG: transcriptional regulator [Verrucomicrobiota bacterium]
MKGFDNLIHQPVRLRIMSSLSSLDSGDSVDFTFLKKLLQLTDGNLGAHLEKLEQAGYLEVEKTFVGKKPKTFLKMTLAGRAAYQGHRAALESLLQDPGGAVGD